MENGKWEMEDGVLTLPNAPPIPLSLPLALGSLFLVPYSLFFIPYSLFPLPPFKTPFAGRYRMDFNLSLTKLVFNRIYNRRKTSIIKLPL